MVSSSHSLDEARRVALLARHALGYYYKPAFCYNTGHAGVM